MGRKPCCSKEETKRGAWTATEDQILIDYIKTRGEGKWRKIPAETGLKRCGKSCRLRWLNYLRPDIKRGNITDDEEDLIIRLHKLLGNRWSLIAGRLPGRTDNEIKNYWNSYLSKKAEQRTKGQTDPELNKLVQEDGIQTRLGPDCFSDIDELGPRQLPGSFEEDDGNAEVEMLWSKDDEFSEIMAGFDSEEMHLPEFVGFDFSSLGEEFVDAFLGSDESGVN